MAKTNFENIKSFTLEEMLEFLNDNCGCGVCSRRGAESCKDVNACKPYILKWLQSEAVDEPRKSDLEELDRIPTGRESR